MDIWAEPGHEEANEGAAPASQAGTARGLGAGPEGSDLKQRFLCESSELFREKGDRSIPGPGLSPFSSQGLKGNSSFGTFLGSR